MLFVTVMLYAKSGFVQVKNCRFVLGKKNYYYVGTNFWYGPILGSEGQGGNRIRLCKELDLMKACGINNLRILVGSDGPRDMQRRLEPTLQIYPGVYNDTILAGLDYLLSEMGKRKMLAVLYLNNSWDWSGGYSFYLEHAGCGRAPQQMDGFDAYNRYASKFANNEKAHQLFYNYVKFIISRTNRYTRKKYVNDPTIMSWEIGNEPRAFSKESIPGFEKWLREASALIRSIDKNHLICLGNEGSGGCENDESVFKYISSDSNIDYVTLHIWPYNAGWAHKDSIKQDLLKSCKNAKRYLNNHLLVCNQLKKPLVIEEFGYPRDGFSFSPKSSVTARNDFYQYMFQLVVSNASKRGLITGCNFWGWGGYGRPAHIWWKIGDDYLTDPATEQQGLNSVFSTDISTLKIIKNESDKLKRLSKIHL